MNARRLTFLLTFALVAMTLASITPVQAQQQPADLGSPDPGSGSVNGGTVVTIEGSNLQQGAIVEILPGEILATGISVASNGNSITFKMPPGKETVNFRITNPGGLSAGTGSFAYQPAPSPTIDTDGLSAEAGSTNGGKTLTIKGANFHTDPFPLVTFDGEPAIVTAGTSSSLTVVTPPGAPGAPAVAVVVTNPAGQLSPPVSGQSATKSGAFAYTDGSEKLSADTRDPTSSTEDGGVTVTIKGEGFAPGASVTFGGEASEKVTFISPDEITAVAPPHTLTAPPATEPRDIVVTNPDGASSGTLGFTYGPATDPVFTSVTPTQGPIVGGTTLTIAGTGFKQGATVEIGGTLATSTTFVSSTQLKAVTPSGTAGAADVVVKNPSGRVTTDGAVAFEYIAPLRIHTVSPASAPTLSGESIGLTGADFEDGLRVFFGDVESPVVTFTSSSVISAELPPQASGAKDVRVVNLDGTTARLTNAFSYTNSAAPIVASIVPTTTGGPATGPSNGGTEVIVGGDHFSTVAGFQPTVKFGSVVVPEEDVISVTATEIKVKVPALTGSLPSNPNLRVSVTNPDGQASNTAACGPGGPPDIPAGCYRYTAADPPEVTDVAPNEGDSNGGDEVTITGTDFAFAAAPDTPAKPTVKFGSVVVPEEDVISVTATEIKVKAPALTGSLPSNPNLRVSVTNPDGKSSGSTSCGTGDTPIPTGCYRYTAAPAPSIGGIDTSGGPSNGGTDVIIRGDDFAFAATPDTPAKPVVRFGSVTVPEDDVTVLPGTDLACPTTEPCIKVKSPGGTPGTSADVHVVNPDGKAADPLLNAFTYASATNIDLASVLPGTAPLIGGTTVTLGGENFALGTPIKPTVKIGATVLDPDDVEVKSATEIEVVVPPRTSAGSASVTVTNPNGQQDSLGGDLGLKYLPSAPAITAALSTTSGSVNGGNTLTITGTNLGLENPSVLFGTGVATITGSPSATSLSVRAPSSSATGLVGVSVVDQNGQSTTRHNAYTYQTSVPSTFTSLSPVTGSVNGGATITVTGQNFVSTATVTIEGKAATGVSASSDGKTLTFVAPSHSLGPKDIVITNPTGPALTIERGFGYLGTAGPTLSSVSPGSGPTSGGTSVTLTGANFVSGATVRFGGTAATGVKVDSATTITATTPSGSAGDVTVTVTNPDGQQASLADGFEYEGDPAPTIDEDLDPDTGGTNGGTEVTIIGTGFLADPTVTFGGTAATEVTRVSSTEITATTPARSTAGAVDVVVTNTDEQQVTATGGFTYTLDAAPTVTAVEPNNGTANGGTEVTITGTGFAPDAVAPTVTFGGTAATEVTVVSATEITATTPAHAAGDVDIVVTNPDTQEGTLTDGFEFRAAPPPVLTSIDPVTGDVAGGTTVTLSGSDFASAAKVSFGGIDADVDFVSATELTAVTPTRTAGAGEVDVVVTNPDGQIDTLAAAFTYTGTLPSVPTDAEIEAANKAVQDSVRVTRSGGTNTVSWDPDAVPDDAAGLQVWRIDSPAVWIADVVRGTAAFTSGEFLDEEGSETSKYLVTVFWDVAGTKYGYSTSAITTLPGYIGLSEKEVEDGATGIGGDGLLTQWWFWVLIGVGALVLILLVVLGVLLSRRGGRDDDESEWGEDDDLGWADEDAGFEPEEHGEEAWSEPPEAGEGRGEWAAGAAAGGHTEEVHTLECPNCQTQFTAGGAKPIVTTCPGCGKRGILR